MRARRRRFLLPIIVATVALLAACRSPRDRLRLATTTSTDDSGLLAELLPEFTREHKIEVDVIAVGTGQALALGAAGDVDVVLVHAPDREAAFVAAGDGLARLPVMYNDFLIVGPASDPARVAGLADVAEALRRIAESQSPFISRGDDSGTHIRELSLWSAADVAPEGAWYRSVGQGMGATLTVAEEEQAYTLSDRGTYLSRRPNLRPLVEGDVRLINPYAVIAVNPARHPTVNAATADLFINWLRSPAAQAVIGQYRVGGELLFAPNADGRCPPTCVLPAKATAPATPPFRFLTAIGEAIKLIVSGDPALFAVVRLSLLVSGAALLAAAALGVPLGAFMGLRHFPGDGLVRALIYTGMGLPPVVVGLFVYLLLSRQGILADLNWLFTPAAMIVAQTILALPMVAGVTMTAVRGVPADLPRQLRSLGATDRQVLLTILHEARYGVVVGLLAGFGAAISEVGAVMLVGGNIAGQTRVLTTAILLETRRGNFALALGLGFILLALAFVANVTAVRWQASMAGRGR